MKMKIKMQKPLDKKRKRRETDNRKVTAEILAWGGAAFGMDLITPWFEFGGATKRDIKVIMNHLKKKYPKKGGKPMPKYIHPT